MKIVISMLGLLTAMQVDAAQFEVENVARYTDPGTGLTIISGQVRLPVPGFWSPDEGDGPSNGLSDIFLVPPPDVVREEMGERGREMERYQAGQQRRRELSMLYGVIRQYAHEHDGTLPGSLDDLLEESSTFARNPFPAREWVHLIPGVPLLDWNNQEGRAMLLFETHPSEDDGKHWVVFNNGRQERLPIDPDLFSVHQAELVRPEVEAPADASRYRILALRRPSASVSSARLPLTNRRTGDAAQLIWSWADAAPGDRALLKQWGDRRVGRWRAMDEDNGASALSHWVSLGVDLYDADAGPGPDDRPRRGRRADRQTNVFNMFGGRAAVRETLQLQALAGTDSIEGDPTIPVGTLTGVNVESHPFEAMLGGQAGGRLALADVAPADRLFAYFARPEHLLQFLEGGSDFLFRGGSSVTGRSVGYDLTSRYLSRLGMNQAWIETFLRSGAVDEVAVLVPDLFLIEGSDVTVVARLKNPKIAAVSLKLLGLSDLSKVVEQQVPDGQAFWTQRGDLLLVSTHAPELDRVLKRIEDPTRESLGRSAEFRYMLTQLPVVDATHSFFYISDPFIRNLVGPAAKIGQLRRLRARTELEAITAGALLYRADGHPEAPTLGRLRETGYAPKPALVQDAILDENGLSRSPTYGTAGRLRSLLAHPVEQVTQGEADAYKQYLDNYNRFWRRFFDPIAIRINQPDEKTMEVSTFILPLVDNALYGGAREFMAPAETSTPLPLPTLDPEPVSTLSLQLNPDMWANVLQDGNFSGLLGRTLGIQLSLLDDLAPDVHIALGDADPIISIGSGGLGSLGGLLGGGDEMFFLSFLVSMLTRPSALLIGLNDPEAFLEKLRQLPTGPVRGDRSFDFGSGGLYKVSGRDAWRYVFSVEGVVSIRFGIEVKDRYLVISNLPLSYNPSLVDATPALHNAGALHLSPAACVDQLAALHASAAEQQLKAAMYGAASLYPFLQAGAQDVPEAQARHRALFGFTPLHPEGGAWVWRDGQVQSSTFGTRWRQESPEHVKGDRAFGTLQNIERVQAAMQFEQDGLRATCRWAFGGRLPVE